MNNKGKQTMENEINQIDKDIDSSNEELLKTKKAKKKETSKDIFASLQGRFIHIKVGNYDRPATDADIEEIKNKFEEIMKTDNIDCAVFVTHHAVEICVI